MKCVRRFQLGTFLIGFAVLVLSAAAGAGCRTAAPEVPNTLNTQWQCDALVSDFDRLTRAAGVMDVQDARVADQPCLRVDRFLLSFADQLAGPEQKAEWIGRARRLADTGRHVELSNFPNEWFRTYFWDQKRSDIAEVLDTCCRLLAEQVSADIEAADAIVESARVPDAYSSKARVLGVYPVTRLFVFPGVWGLHREARQAFQHPQYVDSPAGNWYYPPEGRPDFSPGERAAVLDRARRNSALGIPEPGPEDLARFFDFHAPAFHVLPYPGSDRIGWPYWAEDRIEIDESDPAVFRYHSFTRMEGKIFLQLNYVIWFAKRPSRSVFDLYSGHLDGLTWRVTLDDSGRVLLYDSVHPCGCYHKYYPVSEQLAVREDTRAGEPPLILKDRIPDGEKSRVAIHLTGAEHFVVGLTGARHFVPDMIRYRSAPYDRLRSLPRGNGAGSMFGEDALVDGSQRPERWLLWPMGVPSAGAMRQRGHHAVSFVGKLHFDDPRFFETAFELRPGSTER